MFDNKKIIELRQGKIKRKEGRNISDDDAMPQTFDINFEDVQIERDGGIGRDDVSVAGFAVGQTRRDDESPFLADASAKDALLNPRNHVTTAHLERDRRGRQP